MKKISWFDTAFGVPEIVSRYKRDDAAAARETSSAAMGCPAQQESSPSRRVMRVIVTRPRQSGRTPVPVPVRCLKESPLRGKHRKYRKQQRNKTIVLRRVKLSPQKRRVRSSVSETTWSDSDGEEDGDYEYEYEDDQRNKVQRLADKVDEAEDSLAPGSQSSRVTSSSPSAYHKYTVQGQGHPLQYVYYPMAPPTTYTTYMVPPPPALPPVPVPGMTDWAVPGPPPNIPPMTTAGFAAAPGYHFGPVPAPGPAPGPAQARTRDTQQATYESLQSIKDHYNKMHVQGDPQNKPQDEPSSASDFGEHFCSLCGSTRSRIYHAEHPVSSGKPVKPSLCHRCRYGSVLRDPSQMNHFKRAEAEFRRYWCTRCGTVRSRAYHVRRNRSGTKASSYGPDTCHECREKLANECENNVEYQTNVQTNVPSHVTNPIPKPNRATTPHRAQQNKKDKHDKHNSALDDDDSPCSPSEIRARRIARRKLNRNNHSNVSTVTSTVTSSGTSGSDVVFTPIASSGNSPERDPASHALHHRRVPVFKDTPVIDSDNESASTIIHHTSSDVGSERNVRPAVEPPSLREQPRTPGVADSVSELTASDHEEKIHFCACPNCQGGSHSNAAEEKTEVETGTGTEVGTEAGTEAETEEGNAPPPALRSILSRSRSGSRVDSSGSSTSRNVRFSNPLIVSSGTADSYDRTAHPLNWPAENRDLGIGQPPFVKPVSWEEGDAEGFFWREQSAQDGRVNYQQEKEQQQEQDREFPANVGHNSTNNNRAFSSNGFSAAAPFTSSASSSAQRSPLFNDPVDEDIFRRAMDTLHSASRPSSSSSSSHQRAWGTHNNRDSNGQDETQHRQQYPDVPHYTFSWPSSPPRDTTADGDTGSYGHLHAEEVPFENMYSASSRAASASVPPEPEVAQETSPRHYSGSSSRRHRSETRRAASYPDQDAFEAYMASLKINTSTTNKNNNNNNDRRRASSSSHPSRSFQETTASREQQEYKKKIKKTEEVVVEAEIAENEEADEVDPPMASGWTSGSAWSVDSNEADAISSSVPGSRDRGRYADAASQTDTRSSSRCAVVGVVGGGQQQQQQQMQKQTSRAVGGASANARSASGSAVVLTSATTASSSALASASSARAGTGHAIVVRAAGPVAGLGPARRAASASYQHRDSGVCMDEYPPNIIVRRNGNGTRSVVSSPAKCNYTGTGTGIGSSDDDESEFRSLLTDRVASWLAHTGHSDDDDDE